MKTDRIAFLGDSITHFTHWGRHFPEYDCINFGVSGNQTWQVLDRLDPVLQCEPRAISLLIGTNDLAIPNGAGETPVSGLAAIIARIHESAPDVRLIVNAVMPRAEAFAQTIRHTNDGYRETAALAGVPFVETFEPLADAAGGIRSEFSDDELHLTDAGYRKWLEVLRPFVREAMGSRRPPADAA